MIYLNALLILINVFLTQNPNVEGVTVEKIRNMDPGYNLYMPANKNEVRGVVMLVNGLLDSDNMLLDIYSKEFAKTGCAVLVPQIDGLNNLMLGDQEVNALRTSFNEVIRTFPNVPRGVFTFCFSNGPVFLALNELADKVDFMYLFDSFADMKSMIEYNICEHYEIPGKNELLYIEAIRDISDIYYQNATARLPFERREVFTSALKRNNPSMLNTDEKTLYALLKNRKYFEFERLFNALPEKYKKYLTDISPINQIDKYNCRMTFIHCKRDAMVPYYESVKLFEKSPSKHKKLRLLDLPLHTTDSKSMNSVDIFGKLKYVYEFYMMTIDILSFGDK